MKEYYLDLVGLRTVLQTPGDIIISDNLRPFLCREHTKTDCTIRVQTSRSLPAFPESGVWHGPEYYHHCGGTMGIFHCAAPSGAAFALTEISQTGNITIYVLPDYLSYFSGSEGIFNRIGLETLLAQRQGLLLHASLIEYGGKAIAFAGPSGVGKSTQARLWRDCLGAKVLNGDRAALRKTENTWTAYGSPYAGTSGIYENQNAPLAAIVVLQQDRENHLRPLTQKEAFAALYPEISMRRWDKAFVERATDLCLQLLKDVPVYLLRCRPEERAAVLTKEGLGL
ncbi:MAG: hypothetical protein J6Q92_02470 [Oscillospiraceae bacterium]|nr:hypothetical protein [Oscillospiraceae bacterium]